MRTALWWEKGKIMAWLDSLKGRRTNLLMLVAIILALAKPLLDAHHVSADWVTMVLEGVGFGGVAAMRAAIAAPNGWKSYGAAILGGIDVLAGLTGIVDPATANTVATALLGFGAIGLRAAIAKSPAEADAPRETLEASK